MVDWAKLSKSNSRIKPSNPINIYDELDRVSTTGPLRDTQKTILKEWYYNCRDRSDLIIKMHTGEGKTLVGLLILQSKLNSNNAPCVYVCPNSYLVNQVCTDAKKFGIPVCIVGDDRELPDDFISGRKILIVNAHKMFNGLSKFEQSKSYFGTIDTVILDDSHACIDVIRDASTIKILKNDLCSGDLYVKLFNLFRDDLAKQGEGTLVAMENGKDASGFMVVPFWNWIDKKSKIIELLNEYANINCVKFSLPIVRDSIEDCICCIGSSKIEISQYNPTVKYFKSFSDAKQRVLMSATTQDDSYSIKCLQFSADAVRNPLMCTSQKWYGEKMILIPSLISKECDEDSVRTYVKSLKDEDYGILVIVPSNKKAELYDSEDVAKSNDIESRITTIKENQQGFVVVVNRYDGIDMPDDSCRVLLLDSMPYSDTLLDRYEEKCRSSSRMINKRLAQKIEQGFGRGVRGEKDYCAILIIDSKLVKFIKSTTTDSLFSSQTRKQIEIGLNMAETFAAEESNGLDVVADLICNCIQRNDGWKQYYRLSMDKIDVEENDIDFCDMFEEEREIEQMHSSKNHRALDKLQYYSDKCKDSLEKGWYLQELARFNYLEGNKIKSMELQQSAFEKNENLMRPESIKYKKMGSFYEKRNLEIIDYVCSYTSINEFKLQMDCVLSNLAFTSDPDDFEHSLLEVGKLLGFISQRPEKQCGFGPDNLWKVQLGRYFLFECKNGVKSERQFICKSESAQIDHSCIWFKSQYPMEFVEPYLIHPTRYLEYDAQLDEHVRVITPNKLKSLNENISFMVNELCTYNPRDLTTELVQRILEVNKLNPIDFSLRYSDKPEGDHS